MPFGHETLADHSLNSQLCFSYHLMLCATQGTLQSLCLRTRLRNTEKDHESYDLMASVLVCHSWLDVPQIGSGHQLCKVSLRLCYRRLESEKGKAEAQLMQNKPWYLEHLAKSLA